MVPQKIIPGKGETIPFLLRLTCPLWDTSKLVVFLSDSYVLKSVVPLIREKVFFPSVLI